MASNAKFEFNQNALKDSLNHAFNNTNFEIKCPKCHNVVSIHGSQFGSSIICSHCQSSIFLDDSELRQSISDFKI